MNAGKEEGKSLHVFYFFHIFDQCQRQSFISLYLLYSYHYYIQFSFVDITSFRFYNFRIEQDQNPLIFVSSVLMFFQFHFPFILLILIGSFSPFLFSGQLIPFSDMYGRSQHQYAIIRSEIISSFRNHLYILIFNRVIGEYMFASFQ